MAGAIIFTAYVIAALLGTIFLTASLLNVYSSKRDRLKTSPTHLQLYAALSVLSFSTLSYHMLNYLIFSYQEWALFRDLEVPTQLLGKSGVLSPPDQRAQLYIWTWLKSSTLFLDFAHELCESSANYWWTEQALLATMARSVFMSIEGSFHFFALCASALIFNFNDNQSPYRRGRADRFQSAGPRRRIPHLWAYAVMSQILPFSFVQNLFFLAILLHPITKPNEVVWMPTPIVQIPPFAAYFILVALAPYVVDTFAFIPVVLIIRLLLLCPLIIAMVAPIGWGKTPVKARDVYSPSQDTYIMFGIGAVNLLCLQSLVAFIYSGYSFGSVISAIEQPAVGALGWDYMIALGSTGVWYFINGRALT